MANLTGSAVCLILGQPSTVQKTPIVNQLCRRAHAEALAVAHAHGVVLDDSPDVRYGPKRVYFDHRPSILQDYDLGRPMEIESIVRAPVAFATGAPANKWAGHDGFEAFPAGPGEDFLGDAAGDTETAFR